MDANQTVGVTETQPGGHPSTYIAALDRESGIFQVLGHKLVPHPGNLLYIRTALGGWVGKTEAGQRRSDDVEGIGGITAVGTWVGQQRDDLVHLIESAGPAVGNHQRDGVGTFSPFVDEMDVQPVDLGLEMMEGV